MPIAIGTNTVGFHMTYIFLGILSDAIVLDGKDADVLTRVFPNDRARRSVRDYHRAQGCSGNMVKEQRT